MLTGVLHLCGKGLVAGELHRWRLWRDQKLAHVRKEPAPTSSKRDLCWPELNLCENRFKKWKKKKSTTAVQQQRGDKSDKICEKQPWRQWRMRAGGASGTEQNFSWGLWRGNPSRGPSRSWLWAGVATCREESTWKQEALFSKNFPVIQMTTNHVGCIQPPPHDATPMIAGRSFEK